MTACLLGYQDIVKMLLSVKAAQLKINLTNNTGATALLCSVNSKNFNIVKLLIDNGADINKKNS